MIKQYYITVAILANGKSEEEVSKEIEKKLDTLWSKEHSTEPKLIEDCWIDSIEEDNQ